MKRMLLVRAGHGNELVDDFVHLGIVAVGWSKFGDLSSASADTINTMIYEQYPQGIKLNGEPKKHCAEIIQFAVEAKIGDLVATVDGKRNCLIIGTIGTYKYMPINPLCSGEEFYRHVRLVNWEFVVEREKVGPNSFSETKQLGKTTFWLKENTVESIMVADRKSLAAYSTHLIKTPVPAPQEMSVAPVTMDSYTLVSWLKENERRAINLPNSELIKRAEQASPIPRKVESNGVIYIRDSFVAASAKKLANGVCDLCNLPAPFLSTNGDPYLESHHVTWLSRSGSDSLDNVVALCPNCHRKIHICDDALDRNKKTPGRC